MPTVRKPCPTCSDPKLRVLVEAVRPALVARAADRDPHIAYGCLVAAPSTTGPNCASSCVSHRTRPKMLWFPEGGLRMPTPPRRCRLCDSELQEGDDAFFCSTLCGYIYGCTFASALDAARALLLPPSPLRGR